jgi:hypothetical protein
VEERRGCPRHSKRWVSSKRMGSGRRRADMTGERITVSEAHGP